jgi:hypothetical protein
VVNVNWRPLLPGSAVHRLSPVNLDCVSTTSGSAGSFIASAVSLIV